MERDLSLIIIIDQEAPPGVDGCHIQVAGSLSGSAEAAPRPKQLSERL